MNLHDDLVARVREWRMATGKTNGEIAEELGRKPTTLAAIIGRRFAWRIEDVAGLIRLGVSLPEELKQHPDLPYEAHEITATHERGKVLIRCSGDQGGVTLLRLGHEEAMTFAQSLAGQAREAANFTHLHNRG